MISRDLFIYDDNVVGLEFRGYRIEDIYIYIYKSVHLL